jgi:hypothetical protein
MADAVMATLFSTRLTPEFAGIQLFNMAVVGPLEQLHVLMSGNGLCWPARSGTSTAWIGGAPEALEPFPEAVVAA